MQIFLHLSQKPWDYIIKPEVRNYPKALSNPVESKPKKNPKTKKKTKQGFLEYLEYSVVQKQKCPLPG